MKIGQTKPRAGLTRSTRRKLIDLVQHMRNPKGYLEGMNKSVKKKTFRMKRMEDKDED